MALLGSPSKQRRASATCLGRRGRVRWALAALACGTVACVFLALLALGSALSFDAEDAKNRPVSKVITLLKDMVVQLEAEAKEDEEVYDKTLPCASAGSYVFSST